MWKRPPADTMSVSKFKATCLAVLDRVRRTGRPILITKRGQPIAELVPPSAAAVGGDWLGAARGSARLVGDVVAPVTEPEEWAVLRK